MDDPHTVIAEILLACAKKKKKKMMCYFPFDPHYITLLIL